MLRVAAAIFVCLWFESAFHARTHGRNVHYYYYYYYYSDI